MIELTEDLFSSMPLHYSEKGEKGFDLCSEHGREKDGVIHIYDWSSENFESLREHFHVDDKGDYVCEHKIQE
jgi:hypothetical protein